MKNIKPTKISRPKPYLLKAEWSDGFSGIIKLETLRAKCPCATCMDEDMNSLKGSKAMFPNFSPGKNDLKSLTPVGNYALSAVWGDSHDTGIYPFDYLRDIFEHNNLDDSEISNLEKDEKKYSLPELKLRSN